ncbi:MAG: hypothetical protein H8F28_27065 [Fibrella sp.]|nr:hypothetical protein [Armatimonadota bacterium]
MSFIRVSFRALLVAPLLVLAATIARPTFAEWRIQYRQVDWSGSQGNGAGSSGANNIDIADWDYIGSSMYTSVPAPAKTGKAIANVKFKVYAIWTDPNAEFIEYGAEPTLPPDRIFVKETFSGHASYNPYVLFSTNSYSTGIQTGGSVSLELPFGEE